VGGGVGGGGGVWGVGGRVGGGAGGASWARSWTQPGVSLRARGAVVLPCGKERQARVLPRLGGLRVGLPVRRPGRARGGSAGSPVPVRGKPLQRGPLAGPRRTGWGDRADRAGRACPAVRRPRHRREREERALERLPDGPLRRRREG